MEELSAVKMMESSIKLNLSNLNQSSASVHLGKNAKIRSKLTSDQLAEIKEVYKKQRKFERKLKLKI